MNQFIRCVSGANLNLFRCAAMVFVLLLGVSESAWAGGGKSSNYYASLKISAAGPTGAGSVYVANSNSKPGSANPGTAVTSTSTTTSGGNVTMYYWIDVNAGYNVSLSGGITAGPATGATLNGNKAFAAATSDGESKAKAYTATATFVAVTVNSVDAASKDLAPTNPSTDYPFTVTFATSNLKTIALDLDKSPETADGKFTITSWALDGTNVVATGKFNGGGTYGGASRNNSTTVSLKSKASGSAAKTCTVTANFPAMAFVSVEADDVFATQGESGKTGSATFKYNYAAEDDFPTTPTLTPTSGTGAFTVTGYTVTPDFAKGETTVTVNYSFDTNNGIGETPATLTLTAANGDVRTVTVTGHSEALATNDASVTTTANVTTEYATFAQALAAANATSGATLTLLRNVDLGTITATNNITKAMTIDLNGKELRAAVNATDVGILTIAAAVAVTIKDSKTGGKIINEIARNSAIRTIFVNKAGATLTLESGTIAVNNLGQYASAANSTLGVAKYANCTARAIHQIAGTTVNINGGRVEAYGTRSVYGIVQASSVATNVAGTSVLNITNGEIYAEGPYTIYGICAYGKVNFSNGAITTHVNTNMVDARYAADATQNKYNGNGYGIYMGASSSAAAASCYYGTLEMTGGTVSVTNDRTLNGNYPNYGVYLHAAATNVSSATAVAADGKSRGQIASAKASIDGGEISVISGTQYSHGVYVLGSYNSYDNSNHTVQIKNCKITSKAYVCAYGVSAWGAINTTNGACYAGDVELTNCDVYAESLNTTTASAVWVYATSATIFKDGTTTNAATWGGEFAVAGKAVINSGKYEAKTKTTTAMAVGTSTRAKTVYDPITTVQTNRKPGGNAEAYPTLIIHGGTFKATSTTTTARGVSNGGYCTIDGGTFEAYATTTTAQGLYCLTGKITASGVTISASATGTAYGAFADCGVPSGNTAQTGFAYAGELELNNCDITATTRTSTEARGVVVNATNKMHTWAGLKADSTSNKWATTTYNAYRSVFPCTIAGHDSVGIAIAAKATINGCDIKATAATTTAYGVYAICSFDAKLDSIATPRLNIKNTKMLVKTDGTTTANGIYTQGETVVDGCDITVQPKTTTGYGIQALAPNNEKVTVSNTKITVTTTNTDNTKSAAAYGIYGQVDINATHGLDRHGNLVLNEGNEVNVSTTSGTTAYAVFLNATKRAITTTGGAYRPGDYANAATAIINGGKYTAYAAGTTGYALGVTDPQQQGEVLATPTLIVNGGKFKGTAASTPYADVHTNGETGYFVLNGGYYVKDENLDKKLGEGMNKVAVKSGTPEYTEGYRWRITDNMTGEIVCKVYEGTTLKQSYQSLEEALAYVNLPDNSSKTQVIVMCGNYTLSSGDYELPANKTLLVPYKSSGTGKGATEAVGTSPAWVDFDTKYEAPTPLYKLTMASGVNITVKGSATIEASCVVYVTNGSNGASLLTQGTGIPHGKYGWIYMEEGSHIDLESGATLISWGFITGKGEINAKNGSKVYEDFQMGDWRGGTYESAVNGNKNGLNNKGVFPVTHYYYQNIECPITYRAGSTAYALGGTAVNASIFGTQQAITEPAVQFIGTSGSMFLLDPATAGADTWVRKEYDPETDYVNWTLNSGARIGSITLKMSAMGININLESSNYVLPITTNFNIIANYGDVEISNDVAFLPGSKLTIKKEANVVIPSGKNVFFYDQDDWKSYSGYWFCPGYSPSWKKNPRSVLGANTSIKMPDAEVLIEGILTINGKVYTTAGGSNVYSTRANSGKVVFNASAAASTAAVANFTEDASCNTTLCQWVASNVSSDGKVHYEGKALNSVWLKNEDGGFSKTGSDGANTPSGKTWIYMEDDDHVYRWILSYDDGCFTYKNNGGGDKQLIHPSDWVAVQANANGDHAYHSEDGTRMFVNAGAAASSASCVWWEVDPTPETIGGTKYYIANNEYFDNYGTYFYWDNGTSYWKPKKITVTWKNYDGSKLTNGTYGDEYNFNTSPQFYGTNPTKTNTTVAKYDWIGWRDAEGNMYTKNTTLPRATEDITYTAYFAESKYQYTITFKNDDNSDLWAGLVDAGTTGAELQALFELKYNEKTGTTIPQKAPTVDKVYTFSSWNTSLATVTAAATYTANYTWVTRKYHVTFYNYDAATVLYEADVDYNTRPVYGGVTPFRSNTSAYSYEWTGWQQGATHYGTTDNLALVTGDVYYVATFDPTALKYQVFFKRQDGTTIDAPFFEYEETPTAFPANPTLASTVSTDYTFREWSPAALVPVTEDGKVYTALFDESPRQYTAHFVNYNGTSLNVDQTIDYNTVPAYTGATPFKPNDSRNSFEFAGWAWEAGADWAAGSIGVGEAFPAIKGDITFTAQFTETLLQFNIIYKREDGTVIEQQKKKWGESTAFPSVSNYEDATHTYTFDHWSPATVVTPVTTDATYTAYFNQGVKTYSISNFSISPAGYGTVSPASVTGIPSGAAVTVNGNTFTVNGTTVTAAPATATAQYTYAFDHWNNVPATVTGNVTNIEAVFTRTARSYTLSWITDGDVLTGGYTSGTVAYGTAITAPNTPTKTGYVFAGWHNGTSVVTPATTMPAANTTYTAQWTAVTYSVRFNKNDEDATGTMSNESFTYDVAKALTSNAFTKTGYNFAGWATSAGGNVVYTDGQSVSNLSATQGAVVDMYAKWTVATYEVALNANGGTGGSTSVTMTYNSVDHTAITNPTRTGYTFHSWNTTVSSSTRKQVISSKGVMSENVSGYTGVGGVWIRTTMPTTLYARWSQKSYTTTFTHNGNGSISYDGAVVNAGGTAKVYHVSAKSLVATPNTGYHFTGWTVSGTNASKVTIADLSAASTTIKATAASATVTAGFAPDEYTISYKDQGDAEFSGVHGSGHPTTHTYGTATVLVSPTKEGYTFDGWYDNAECTGTALTEIGATDYTADFTLYAKWTLNKYSFTIGVTPTSYGNVDVASITQIPHGSAVTVTDNKFTVNGTTVTATPTATTAEYTYAFSKWNNVPNTVTANVTNITAEFTRTINQYTLTVEANNDAMGTVSGGGTYDYNTVRTISASPKDGYKFVQWNDESTDNPRTVTVTANATYTATFDYDIANYTVKHWKQNIYDDDYTEEVADRQTNLSGTIGAQTNAEAKTYTGFTAQPISQQTIVVEGTTVVNIYYNRNTYTIEWQVDGVTKKNETVRYGATPSYGDDPTKAETAQYTYSFSGWSPTPYAADKDQTYSGSFNASVHYYTITWKNWNGEDLRSDYLQYGAQVTYGGSTPTKTDSETERSYTFKGWSPEVVDVAGDATYTAQFDLALTIGEGEHPYEVSGEETATITTVLVQGALKVPDGNNLTTNDLIIKASANNSGDIEGVENVSVTGHAYFDYVFDVDAWHWSAFGVPFEIDLDEFAPLKEKTTPMVLGTDYDIVYYNTKTRAQQGPGKRNWEYVENHEHKLIPGMAYLIAFNHPVGHVNTVRFTKASSAPINYTTAVPLTVTGAKGGDNNWNGIANPKMYHALLDAGVEECQVHDSGPIGGDGYDLYTMKSGETDYKFFVGKAAFVQTPQEKSVVEIDPATTEDPINIKQNAPRRAGAFEAVNPKYDIRIAPIDGEMADRLFIRAEEGKEDDYVIVADLAKAGVSPARAQIWVDRYGYQLCKNTTALINDMATYPLGISVPQAGEYSLYMANEVAEDDNLYLTYDGRVIWNLGYAPYILSLEKGVNEHYGLRLIHNTPAMEMDVEQVEATRAAQKMLIDQKVYILRGEQLYYITGQKAE